MFAIISLVKRKGSSSRKEVSTETVQKDQQGRLFYFNILHKHTDTDITTAQFLLFSNLRILSCECRTCAGTKANKQKKKKPNEKALTTYFRGQCGIKQEEQAKIILLISSNNNNYSSKNQHKKKEVEVNELAGTTMQKNKL